VVEKNLTDDEVVMYKVELGLKNSNGETIGKIGLLKGGKEVLNYLAPSKGNYDLKFESEKAWGVIRGVNISRDLKLLVWVDDYSGETPHKLNTPVVVFDDAQVEFEKATIVLRKYGITNVILHCNQWDFESFSCEEWRSSKDLILSSGQNATHIWFTVTDFTAWAAGEVGLSFEVISPVKLPTEMALWLDGTRGARTYTRGEVANLTAALNVSDKIIQIYANFTGVDEIIASGLTPLTNLTNTSTLLGVYSIRAYFGGDATHNQSEEKHLLKVIPNIKDSIISPCDTTIERTNDSCHYFIDSEVRFNLTFVVREVMPVIQEFDGNLSLYYDRIKDPEQRNRFKKFPSS
jgi:hypothetical protein